MPAVQTPSSIIGKQTPGDGSGLPLLWTLPGYPGSTGQLSISRKASVVVETGNIIDADTGRLLWTVPGRLPYDRNPDLQDEWDGVRWAVHGAHLVVCELTHRGVEGEVRDLRTGGIRRHLSPSRIPAEAWLSWLNQRFEGERNNCYTEERYTAIAPCRDRLRWHASADWDPAPGPRPRGRVIAAALAAFGSEETSWAMAAGLDERTGETVWRSQEDHGHWFYLGQSRGQTALFRPWPEADPHTRSNDVQGTVKVLATATGTVLWRYHWCAPQPQWPMVCDRGTTGAAAAVAGRTVVTAEPGEWVGRSLETGRELWRTSDPVPPSPTATVQVRYLRQFDQWACFDVDHGGLGSILLHGPTGALVRFHGKVDAVLGDRLYSAPESLEDCEYGGVGWVHCYQLPVG